MERLIITKGQENEEHQRVVLLKRTRVFIWLTFVFLGINCAIVNGVLATAGGKIKADSRMMNLEFSTFLAFYAIGRMIGALFHSAVANVANKKYLLIFACVLKAGAIYLFTASTCYTMLMCSRLFTGIANAIVSANLGAWVAQYATPKYKPFMAAFIGFATPIGRSYGIMFEMYFGGPSNWKLAFTLNSLGLLFCAIILMCFPSIYFSTKLSIVTEGKENILRPHELSYASVFNVRQSEAGERDFAIKSKVTILATNGIYFFLLICRLTIALINASFVFGMPNFIAANFPTSPKKLRTWLYAGFIVTGPFIGGKIGAKLTKKVGGFEKKGAFVTVLILDILLTSCLFPLTFLEDWRFFILNFYGYLIFGNAFLPTLVGIINTSVPGAMKPKANKLANLMTTTFGGFLAPLVFGTVNANHAAEDKRYVMKFMLGYAIVGVVAMTIATIARFAKGDEEKKPQQESVQLNDVKAEEEKKDDNKADENREDEKEDEFQPKIK